ncbi:MAG: secreted peptidyl prolyl cis-trans isomerase, cyclophilin type precursor protein [Steroidobacteraceae bacterium]|nr:secreted peptidyl prolyl cis-trans isomerase, cyclophilin type precursor protein [Steroidobacteraceae bacterium]
MSRAAALLLAVAPISLPASAGQTTPPPKAPTTAEVLAASKPEDWRRLDPADTLYVDLAAGRVVIELSRVHAPRHVAAIKSLAQARYWDGLAINRVQDNFVVQWGDPDNQKPAPKIAPMPPEFVAPLAKGLPFTALPDADGWAKQVGFTQGMAAARSANEQWLVHCYGALGVGRDNAPESGLGNELYVVIGQSPRQLDGNVAVVGKVWRGMELLAALPRGTGGGLGLYEKMEQRVPIRSLRLASDVPATERTNLEVLREDREIFANFVESRRNRRDEWYVRPAGHVDVCNLAIPVRDIQPPAK